MSCYGTAFSVEYRMFLEDFTLQGCGDVLLGKHPMFHRPVVHSGLPGPEGVDITVLQDMWN